VFDNPYTRGLFDPTTGVYYAADAFCAPMPAQPVDWVDEMPEDFWAEGFAVFHHNSLCPWVTMVDAAKFASAVAGLRAVGPTVVTSSHSASISAASMDRAFELLVGLPSARPRSLREVADAR
jgi:hypothetical protein